MLPNYFLPTLNLLEDISEEDKEKSEEDKEKLQQFVDNFTKNILDTFILDTAFFHKGYNLYPTFDNPRLLNSGSMLDVSIICENRDRDKVHAILVCELYNILLDNIFYHLTVSTDAVEQEKEEFKNKHSRLLSRILYVLNNLLICW